MVGWIVAGILAVCLCVSLSYNITSGRALLTKLEELAAELKARVNGGQ